MPLSLKERVEKLGGETWQTNVIFDPWLKLYWKIFNWKKGTSYEEQFETVEKF